VSTLCLGTMTFGEEWGWGADKATSGTSKRWVGEFVRADRARFMLGTKYSLSTVPDDPNAGGNHRKNLRRSVESSLRRLGTDHLDVLWLHVWDSKTPVEEILRGLDDVLRTRSSPTSPPRTPDRSPVARDWCTRPKTPTPPLRPK
jgi:aryl-alcohol dehydrogenase-like predicted oxidoreductase